MADYDVIVAGGGLTGTIAAQAISYYSKQNLRILSLDKNPEFYLEENQVQDGHVEMHVQKKQ